MDIRRRPAALTSAASLLVVLALAGACDSGRDAASPSATMSSGVSASPQAMTPDAGTPGVTGPVSAPTAAMTRVPPLSTAADSAQRLVTLRGTLVQGVEGGCLILNADNGRSYQLIDLDEHLARPGIRLEVRGHKAVGMQSICMQGILFKVVSAHRL